MEHSSKVPVLAAWAALAALTVLVACAGPQVAGAPLVATGDTFDKVQRALGLPNAKLARKVLDQDLEIWSYERPNRFFTVDDCAGFVEHPFRISGQQVDGRQCRERARVVFSAGKVVAYEQKD